MDTLAEAFLIILFIVYIFFVIFVAVDAKRKELNAKAWASFAGLLPFVGIPAYFMFRKVQDEDEEGKKKRRRILIIVLIIMVIWWLFPGRLKYEIFYNMTNIPNIIIYGLGFSYIIYYVFKANRISGYEKDTTHPELSSYVAEYKKMNEDFWSQLGTNKKEREKNINRIFDEKKITLIIAIRHNFYDRIYKRKKFINQGDQKFVAAAISQSLASMDQNIREFLRITYLLQNEGLLTEGQWDKFRYAFIFGDGKAHRDTCSWSGVSEINDKIITAQEWLLKEVCTSTNAQINDLLLVLESNEDKIHLKSSVGKIKGRLFGTGAWLSEDDIEESVFNPNGDHKLQLGELEDSNVKLSYSGEGSLITIAPPGSGKTQCFVLPNMFEWRNSALVLDIKGEIYQSTHRWRKHNVGKVYKFSPLEVNNTAFYNPLSFVRNDPNYIWEDSRFLADMMIVPSNSNNDPFWEAMARDVLTAAISYICLYSDEDDRPMSKVLDLIWGIGWDEMILSLKGTVLVHAMKQTGYSLSEIDKKQRDSILKTAQSSLSAWQGQRIANATRKSDWHPLDLREGNITVYMCINPNEIDSYLSVIRVFIAQHLRILTSKLPPRESSPVLFMLDELPRLKKMPPVEEALQIGRQYGIKLWMFAQSFGQIKEAYPDPEGLIGSCMVRTFMNLPLNDEMTSKLSDQLGYRHDALGNTKEKLVEPKDLAGPEYKDTILVLATNTKPAKIKKHFAYLNSELVVKMN